MGSGSDLPFHHRIWRLLPPRLRREALACVTALLAPRAAGITGIPGSFPGGVIVAGELSRDSGLGEGARLMARALRESGIPCATWDTARREAGGDSVGPRAPLIAHVNAPVLPLELLRMPRAWRSGRRIIGYWAWELPRITPEWRPAARNVDEIWAPSRFCAAAFEALGKPVRVVPHPVGLIEEQPSTRDRASFGLPREALVVLVSFNLASSMVRKNPIGAIRAFREAFGTRPDRVLLLKIGHPEHYADDLAAIRAEAEAPNIRLMTESLSGPDRLALTACADVVLSLHRSEGFGLVAAEAMALGRCVVATDWSATAEFLDSSCGLPVPYALVPARDPRGVLDLPDAVWAEPDIAAAAHALRRAADEDGLRLHLGEAARLRIRARFGGGTLRESRGEALGEALAGIGVC